MTKRKQNNFLTKANLLEQGNLLKRDVCYIEQLNGYVYVQELCAYDILQYKNEITRIQAEWADSEITPEASLELMSYLVSMTVCDAKGVLLFTRQEAKGMIRGSLTVLTQLANAAMKVCGISQDAIAEAQEKLKKAADLPSTSN